MNPEQIKKLGDAFALLIAAIFSGLSTSTSGAAPKKAAAPAAPVAGADLLGDAAPAALAADDLLGGDTAPAPAPVAAPAKPKAAPKAPVGGLIDVTSLTGLAKARAVAHNNRVNAAAGGAAAAPVAAPAAAPVAAPAAPATKKAPAKVKAAPAAAAPAIDTTAIKNLGLKLLQKDKVNGHPQLQAILQKHGGQNLTTLPVASYPAVYAELQALVG